MSKARRKGFGQRVRRNRIAMQNPKPVDPSPYIRSRVITEARTVRASQPYGR